jgi:hypothetical protein
VIFQDTAPGTRTNHERLAKVLDSCSRRYAACLRLGRLSRSTLDLLKTLEIHCEDRCRRRKPAAFINLGMRRCGTIKMSGPLDCLRGRWYRGLAHRKTGRARCAGIYAGEWMRAPRVNLGTGGGTLRNPPKSASGFSGINPASIGRSLGQWVEFGTNSAGARDKIPSIHGGSLDQRLRRGLAVVLLDAAYPEPARCCDWDI